MDRLVKVYGVDARLTTVQNADGTYTHTMRFVTPDIVHGVKFSSNETLFGFPVVTDDKMDSGTIIFGGPLIKTH